MEWLAIIQLAMQWLQGALNKLIAPSPNLVLDGIYRRKTVAAVEALQAKLGLKVDGLAGQLTQVAILAELAKLQLVTGLSRNSRSQVRKRNGTN